jgi:hypothetical protein
MGRPVGPFYGVGRRRGVSGVDLSDPLS